MVAPLGPRRSAEISRRAFLARAGAVGVGAILAQLPAALRARGWLDVAAAQDLDLTRDTINGLIAFVVPGPDEYSLAQGESTQEPGGIAAGGTENLILNLDRFVPAPDIGQGNDETVPLSGAVANLLNVTAATVNPVAAGGPFPSHFSRLAFAEKAEVFRTLEATPGSDEASGNVRFTAGILPGFATFLCFGEWHALDPATRQLRERPVGWDLTRYQPGRVVPAEGWP
ncbi:MAG: hypothetical protein ACRDJP_02945, partial [Actinomycetota bacterium]